MKSKRRTARGKPKTLLRPAKRKPKRKQLTERQRAKMAWLAGGGRRLRDKRTFTLPGWLGSGDGGGASHAILEPLRAIAGRFQLRSGSSQPIGRKTERGGIIKMHSYVIGHLDRWKSP